MTQQSIGHLALLIFLFAGVFQFAVAQSTSDQFWLERDNNVGSVPQRVNAIGLNLSKYFDISLKLASRKGICRRS